MINRSSKMIEDEMKDNQEVIADTKGALDNDGHQACISYP